MGLMKELNDLNRIYQQMHKQEVSEDENKGYVVTRADKKGNTPAWQGYKAGKKKKDGKPMYRAADHLKTEGYEDVEEGVYEKIKKKEILAGMTKKGIKISKRDKEKIADKVVALKGDTSKSDDRYAYESIEDERIDIVKQIQKAASEEDIKRWAALAESGKFSEEEIKSIIWNEGYQRDPEQQEKERKTSKQTDPSKDGFTGIGDSIEDIMKQNAAMKAAAKKKTKKEGYQRNPEKGEAEERKRSQKVRGERTPMPPRGDKRREDFEKWYAANVR